MIEAPDSWSLTRREKVLQALRKLVYKTQWQQIDKSIVERKDETVETREDALELVRKVMESCDGALDVFGPPKLLTRDISRFLKASQYMDSKLRYYIPKNEIFPYMTTIAKGAVQDPVLYGILVNTIEWQVRNQLAGRFDIVSKKARYDMKDVLTDRLEKFEKEPIDNEERTSWNLKTREQVFEEFMKFWKLPNDSGHWIQLRDYIKSSKPVTYEAFAQFRKLYHLLDAMITEHKYVFDTFDSAEKAPNGEKFDTFIRLFHDGKEKFLFREDVEREFNRLNVPKGFLKTESPTDIAEGRLFIITYPKYLKMLDHLRLSKDDITLVNVEVKRIRHVAVPIISPFGKECKPLADTFFEILSSLTIELQAWQRIPSDKIQAMVNILLNSFRSLLDPRTPDHLVSTHVIGSIGSKLRHDVGRLLEGPIQHVESFENPKPMTWYLLYEEVIENWKLERIFPDIGTAMNSVFTKHVDFEKTKMISRLELTMLVQECIALCFLSEDSGMLHCLGLCPLARQTFCDSCTSPCQRPAPSKPQSKAIFQTESEFQFRVVMVEEVVHPCLVELKRRNAQCLHKNSNIGSFLLKFLLEDIPLKKEVTETLQMNFQNELMTKWKNPEDRAKFYITADEMVNYVMDIKEKQWSSVEEEVLKLSNAADQAPEKDFQRIMQRILHTLTIGVVDWMKYANRCFKSQTALSAINPGRCFYIKYFQLLPADSNQKECYVNSGEFLEVVKILLDQRPEAVCKDELDTFEKLSRSWLSGSGWIDVRVEEIQKTLVHFSVDSKRFRFVPDLWSFFRTVVTTDWSDMEEGSEEDEDGSEDSPKEIQINKL